MANRKAHGKNLRKGRASIPGQIYLVTTTTNHREPAFRDLYDDRLLVGCLRRLEQDGYAETLAYVIMPDHLHWLLQIGAELSLSEVVRRLKGKAAPSINLRRNRGGQGLWQSGFHDHAVRKEEDLQAIARYMVANSVRAGLVERVGDYPHWDAIWLSPLRRDRQVESPRERLQPRWRGGILRPCRD